MKQSSLHGLTPFGFLLFLSLPAILQAQDFDDYKLRLEGSFFYSNPSGDIEGRGESVPIDFHRDFGFSSYPTFSGKVDWKFARKHHFVVGLTPLYSSRQTILQRTILFQGQTFNAGLATQSELHAFLFAPGYQYDFIRRKRGHLGLGVQFDLFNTSAKINAAAQVTGNGVRSAAVSASGSILAPIPVAGPQFRLYLTDSPRVFVDGGVNGMYFFGYGSFVSTSDSVGVTLNKHISVKAGYQVGSRLIVKGQTDRIGLHLTQKGPIAGLEFSF